MLMISFNVLIYIVLSVEKQYCTSFLTALVQVQFPLISYNYIMLLIPYTM